jgi:hypothetical protein
MAYSEWLRVRGCLKWTGIVLGVLFVVGVVLRIAVIGAEHSVYGWMARLKTDPGTKVTDTVLPDGTKRTSIEDPVKKMRVILDDRGWNGKHIVIYDWSPTAKQDLSERWRGGVASVVYTPDKYGRGERLDIDTDGTTPAISYLVAGLVLALIVATVLGAPLAREADGHLEVALVKPVSRERFALEIILVDWLGLIATFAGGTIFAILIHAIFDLPHITFGPRDAAALAGGIVAPLAWYGMLTAATASMKRGYAAIVGFAWPVAAIVLALSLVQPEGNLVLTAVHDVAWVLSWIDPLSYMHFGSATPQVGGNSAHFLSGAGQLVALVVLSIGYAAIAIVQWKRIEA